MYLSSIGHACKHSILTFAFHGEVAEIMPRLASVLLSSVPTQESGFALRLQSLMPLFEILRRTTCVQQYMSVV